MRAMRAIQTSFKGASTEFLAWMIRIARNRFLDHVKSGRVRWEVVVDETPVTLAVGNPETEALEAVAGGDLRKALDAAHGRAAGDRVPPVLRGPADRRGRGRHGRTEGAVKALQFRALRALERVIVTDPTIDVEGRRVSAVGGARAGARNGMGLSLVASTVDPPRHGRFHHTWPCGG